jgi:hypothetical protein
VSTMGSPAIACSESHRKRDVKRRAVACYESSNPSSKALFRCVELTGTIVSTYALGSKHSLSGKNADQGIG